MTLINECNLPLLVNGVQRVSLSTNNPSTSLTPTSLAQANKQTTLHADQCQLSTRPWASTCAMITNDHKAAATVQLANMTMFVYSHSVWGITPNGSTQLPTTAKPEHLPAELSPNSLVGPLAGGSSTTSPIAGKYPYVSLETAECVTDFNQSALMF